MSNNNELRCQFQKGDGCGLTVTGNRGAAASTQVYCDKNCCPIWQTYILTMKLYIKQGGEDE